MKKEYMYPDGLGTLGIQRRHQADGQSALATRRRSTCARQTR